MSTAARADRLSLVLSQLRGVPYLSLDEAFALTSLTPVGYATVPEVTEDDLALAASVQNVEAALREEQYKALEWLCALIAGTQGTLQERVLAVGDRPELVEAAETLFALGWIDRD